MEREKHITQIFGFHTYMHAHMNTYVSMHITDNTDGQTCTPEDQTEK